MTQIGHWPTLKFEAGFGSTPYTAAASITWTDITQWVEGPLSIRRGQQYELAQTQTGQATLTVRNWDGRFDPLNTAGPYYPLKVWTPFRITAGSASLFYGFVERWPQTWASNGNRFGTEQLTIVDAFAPLSQHDMWAAIYHEIASYNPAYLYTMDDTPSSYGPQQFADFMGGPPLSNTGSPWAAGGLGPGTTIAAGKSVSPQPVGMPGPFAAITLDSTATSGSGGLTLPTFTPAVPTNGFTVIFAAEMSGVPENDIADIALASDCIVQYENGKVQFVSSTVSGFTGPLPAGMSLFIMEATPYREGDTTQNVYLYWGASNTDHLSVTQIPAYGPQRFSLVYQHTSSSASATVRVSLAAILDGNPVDHDRLFGLFYGGFTDSTGDRFQDIIKWSGWPGTTIIDNYPSGQTTTCGDPVEMLTAASADGTNTLQLLQTVVDTDAGDMYVDVAGNVVFRSRRHRITTPDNPAGPTVGEDGLTYTQAMLDYDPTHITNSVLMTQAVTNATHRTVDATSVDEYGAVSMSRTVNDTDWQSILDASNWILYQYAEPVPYGQVTIDLAAASADAWATATALELGDHIQFTRTPIGSPAISLPAVVEQISWAIDGTGKAQLTLAFESAALMDFLMIGQSALTLHTAATAGDTSIVVNAMPDAATNGLDDNLGPGDDPTGYVAQSWLIDDGANSEIVVLTTIPHTGTGYTTATVDVHCTAYLVDDVAWSNPTGSALQYDHAAGVRILDAGGCATGVNTDNQYSFLPAAVQSGSWVDASASTVGRKAGY